MNVGPATVDLTWTITDPDEDGSRRRLIPGAQLTDMGMLPSVGDVVRFPNDPDTYFVVKGRLFTYGLSSASPALRLQIFLSSARP